MPGTPSTAAENKEPETVSEDPEVTEDKKALEDLLRKGLDSARENYEKGGIKSEELLRSGLNTYLLLFKKKSPGATEVELDSVKVKVAKFGEKTYEGLKEWVDDLDKKITVGKVFEETYGMAPEHYRFNSGRLPRNAEEFANLVAQDMRIKIDALNLKSILTRPLKVFSKSRTFTAFIKPDGTVRVDVDPEWAEERFKKVDSPPGT